MKNFAIGESVSVVLDGREKWKGRVVGTYTEVRHEEFIQGYLVRPVNANAGFWLNDSVLPPHFRPPFPDINKMIGFTSVVPCHPDSLVSIENSIENEEDD